MKKIITHPSVTAHNPTILLVTPPPINELHLEEEDLKKGYSAVTRHQTVSATYANVIRDIVEEFMDPKVLLVDLWVAMMIEARRLNPNAFPAMLGSKESGSSAELRTLLSDGIHLTGDGYAVFLREVMRLVGTKVEDGHADAAPWTFPQVPLI